MDVLLMRSCSNGLETSALPVWKALSNVPDVSGEFGSFIMFPFPRRAVLGSGGGMMPVPFGLTGSFNVAE